MLYLYHQEEQRGLEMTITVIRARNQKYTGKTYELTEIQKDYEYEITIGKSVYHCFVDKSKSLNFDGYKTRKEQSLKSAICFHKIDAVKSSMLWFTEFSIA